VASFLVAFKAFVLQELSCLTMMASIVSIAIGGHLNRIHRDWRWRVACCCLSRLRVAVTILCLQLHFN
jgi:hypothetical protein